MKIVFFLLFLSSTAFASESPQRDLYKIDSKDWYFNHKQDYAINQPEYSNNASQSDGTRMISEAQAVERKMKKWTEK